MSSTNYVGSFATKYSGAVSALFINAVGGDGFICSGDQGYCAFGSGNGGCRSRAHWCGTGGASYLEGQTRFLLNGPSLLFLRKSDIFLYLHLVYIGFRLLYRRHLETHF